MDKKIFEMSVLMSETDGRLYYDADLQNITNSDNLLQVIKSLQEVHNSLFDTYLNKIGIDVSDKKMRIK